VTIHQVTEGGEKPVVIATEFEDGSIFVHLDPDVCMARIEGEAECSFCHRTSATVILRGPAKLLCCNRVACQHKAQAIA
jgi:hypothetical protein